MGGVLMFNYHLFKFSFLLLATRVERTNYFIDVEVESLDLLGWHLLFIVDVEHRPHNVRKFLETSTVDHAFHARQLNE